MFAKRQDAEKAQKKYVEVNVEVNVIIIFSVAKYLHREMKSYTLRSET